MKASKPLAVLLGVALAGGLAWWFLATLEPLEERVRAAASPEALRNPLLAAERTLRRLGVDSQVVLGHELAVDRLGAQDAVWYYRDRGPLNPGRRDALLDWVAGGGHLVMDAVYLRNARAARNAPDLVRRFGVAVIDVADGDAATGPVGMQFQDADTDVEVAFDRHWELLDTGAEADARVAGARGAHLLQFDHGQGLVSIAADHDFIANDNLADHDHAYYLYELTAGAGKVWLVHRTELPGLLARLWTTAPLAVLLAALLTGMLIWRGALRLGPLLRHPAEDQRDLVGGLAAQGDFLWRHAGIGDLLAQGREAAERSWYECNPALRPMDETTRCAWIAARAGLQEEQVREALYAPAPQPRDFVRLTALLQRLAANSNSQYPRRKRP